MPDAAIKSTDLIIGHGLIAAEVLLSALRSKLVSVITRNRDRLTNFDLLGLAREVLDEYTPMVAVGIRDTDLAAWLAGVYRISERLPEDAMQAIEGYTSELWFPPGSSDYLRVVVPPVPPPPRTPTVRGFSGGDDEEPTVRFPMIERAAKSLFDRNVVPRPIYDGLAQDARNHAFTVAGQMTDDALETVRDTLAEDLLSGASFKQFRKNLAERMDTSAIGPRHLETVYRTNVQTAFSDGQEWLAANPIVEAVFPYQEYQPIRDKRCRPEHLALGKLGLDGTGIYRRDDPMWGFFTPPWSFNCRCGTTLLTLEAAARAGVREAQRWIKTGQPPVNPEWRIGAILFRPEHGFGGRSKRLRAA